MWKAFPRQQVIIDIYGLQLYVCGYGKLFGELLASRYIFSIDHEAVYHVG